MSMRDVEKHWRDVVPTGKPLSKTEMRVLALISQGMSGAAIARELNRSMKTVWDHRAGIIRKTGATNEVLMLLWALRNGVVTLADVGLRDSEYVFLSANAFNVAELTERVVEAVIKTLTERVMLRQEARTERKNPNASYIDGHRLRFRCKNGRWTAYLKIDGRIQDVAVMEGGLRRPKLLDSSFAGKNIENLLVMAAERHRAGVALPDNPGRAAR